jgi:hypothetical protein
MLVIFLRNFPGIDVELHDLLVGTASKKDVLLILVRVKFYDVRKLACCERLDAFTCRTNTAN